MSKNIAIISGKGGSGKTSVALSFAKTLSDMKLKVLFIDCDMSTHGATFFMRPQIENHRKKKAPILAVDDILVSACLPPYGFLSLLTNRTSKKPNEEGFSNLINVENNFYFMPSDVSISSNNQYNKRYLFEGFESFLKYEISECFDIVIMDCQAGYSDFTRCVLRNSNIALLVTEPDSVSAAANRALCFQMGLELDSIQTYQIFSKLTQDEYVHYTETSTSSFFTNLSPIIFDLQLRRTFIYLLIPSAETVNIEFEKNILTILSILLPEHKDKIHTYRNHINDTYISNLEKQLELLELKRRKKKKTLVIDFINMLIPLVATALVLTLEYINSNTIIGVPEYIGYMAAIILLISLTGVVIATVSKNRNRRTLSELDDEILRTKKQIASLDVESMFSEC